jgi:LmbE family N-acetylglucosaminyl deacetylase
MNKPTRVLIVAPHPDDEVLGCGGVMARHAAEGAEVQVVVVTRGIEEKYPDSLIAQVRGELAEAHRILGISGVRYLEFPAPRLDTIPRHELADAIRAVLSEFRPEIVYVPHHGDVHLDHGQVYHAVLVAARPLSNCPVRRLLSYETLSETEWSPPRPTAAFHPTVFVDIAEYLEKKLAAMACYRSQLKEPPNPRSLRNIEALARVRGATIDTHAAEAFMLIRDITR